MKLWVFVYEEHFVRFLQKNQLEESPSSFQQFLKEIGTPSLAFQETQPTSNYCGYKEVPLGSCIRLYDCDTYREIIHEKLYRNSYEKEDKSRRKSSCVIV